MRTSECWRRLNPKRGPRRGNTETYIDLKVASGIFRTIFFLLFALCSPSSGQPTRPGCQDNEGEKKDVSNIIERETIA